LRMDLVGLTVAMFVYLPFLTAARYSRLMYGHVNVELDKTCK
jgi:hypothetical protein